MPDIFGTVIAKAAIVAVFSLVASFGISALIVPLLGGRLEGAGLIMTLTLPVVISFPASAVQFWQFETTRRLKDELAAALLQLDDVNAQLVSTNLELIRQRSHDPLTRLLTEEIFRERLVSQPNMADIGQLVRVRLDGLLELKKVAGSAAAETAIFTVAAAIRRALRPIDYAGRIGDHEFAIFMPGSTPILASLAFGSICSTIAAIHFRMDGNASTPITVSAGGIECAPGFDIAEALEAAAAELEKSTAQGGNCSHWGKLRLESAFARPVS